MTISTVATDEDSSIEQSMMDAVEQQSEQEQSPTITAQNRDLVDQGKILFDNGHYQEALVQFDRARVRQEYFWFGSPHNGQMQSLHELAKTYYWTASAHSELQEWSEALSAYRHATRISLLLGEEPTVCEQEFTSLFLKIYRSLSHKAELAKTTTSKTNSADDEFCAIEDSVRHEQKASALMQDGNFQAAKLEYLNAIVIEEQGWRSLGPSVATIDLAWLWRKTAICTQEMKSTSDSTEEGKDLPGNKHSSNQVVKMRIQQGDFWYSRSEYPSAVREYKKAALLSRTGDSTPDPKTNEEDPPYHARGEASSVLFLGEKTLPQSNKASSSSVLFLGEKTLPQSNKGSSSSKTRAVQIKPCSWERRRRWTWKDSAIVLLAVTLVGTTLLALGLEANFMCTAVAPLQTQVALVTPRSRVKVRAADKPTVHGGGAWPELGDDYFPLRDRWDRLRVLYSHALDRFKLCEWLWQDWSWFDPSQYEYIGMTKLLVHEHACQVVHWILGADRIKYCATQRVVLLGQEIQGQGSYKALFLLWVQNIWNSAIQRWWVVTILLVDLAVLLRLLCLGHSDDESSRQHDRTKNLSNNPVIDHLQQCLDHRLRHSLAHLDYHMNRLGGEENVMDDYHQMVTMEFEFLEELQDGFAKILQAAQGQLGDAMANKD